MISCDKKRLFLAIVSIACLTVGTGAQALKLQTSDDVEFEVVTDPNQPGNVVHESLLRNSEMLKNMLNDIEGEGWQKKPIEEIEEAIPLPNVSANVLKIINKINLILENSNTFQELLEKLALAEFENYIRGFIPAKLPEVEKEKQFDSLLEQVYEAIKYLHLYKDIPITQDDFERFLKRWSDNKTVLRIVNALELLERNKKKFNINSRDIFGGTLLHTAAYNGRTEVARLLIESGADVNAQDMSNHTPLHQAVISDHTEVARRLIYNKADVNAKTKVGQTPLHEASARGNTEVTKLLIDKNADVNARGLYGWTPLHRATAEGHREIARLLIEEGGAVVNAQTDGLSPLHLAAQNGHTEVVNLLLEKGALVGEYDISVAKTPEIRQMLEKTLAAQKKALT